MAKYRNVRTGRELTFRYADEWLEASEGWERVDEERAEEPEASEPEAEHEGSND